MATSRPNADRIKAHLRGLRVKRVDLVPAGANGEAHVTLAKATATGRKPGDRRYARDQGGRFSEIAAQLVSNLRQAGGGRGGQTQGMNAIQGLKELAPYLDTTPNPDGLKRGNARMKARSLAADLLKELDVDIDPDDVLDEMASPGKTDDPKVRAAVKRLRASTKKEAPVAENDTQTTLADEIAALSDEEQDGVKAYVEALAAELEEARGKIAELSASDEEEDEEEVTEETSVEELVAKGIPAAVAQRIQKAEAAAADAQERAERIEKAERQRVFKATAASMAKLSGGDEGAASLGSILEKANAALPQEDYQELERVLVAADTQLSQSADLLMKSLGEDGDSASGEFVSTVKSRAEVLISEGTDPVEAFRVARREQGEAAADHLDNVRHGTRS